MNRLEEDKFPAEEAGKLYQLLGPNLLKQIERVSRKTPLNHFFDRYVIGQLVEAEEAGGSYGMWQPEIVASSHPRLEAGQEGPLEQRLVELGGSEEDGFNVLMLSHQLRYGVMDEQSLDSRPHDLLVMAEIKGEEGFGQPNVFYTTDIPGASTLIGRGSLRQADFYEAITRGYTHFAFVRPSEEGIPQIYLDDDWKVRVES